MTPLVTGGVNGTGSNLVRGDVVWVVVTDSEGQTLVRLLVRVGDGQTTPSVGSFPFTRHASVVSFRQLLGPDPSGGFPPLDPELITLSRVGTPSFPQGLIAIIR